MIRRIISGGQTGADFAGLLVAKHFGIETGGWMPAGFLNHNGFNPHFEKLFGVQSHSSGKYPPRTFANVAESDGTMRFAVNFNTPGEKCTLKAIQQLKRPYFDVDLSDPPRLETAIEWVKEHGVSVLNVAGNSIKSYQFAEMETALFLFRMLSRLLEVDD